MDPRRRLLLHRHSQITFPPPLATYLGVSIRTIDALMKKKKIGYLKLSRKLVRFRKADVDAHLASNYRVMAFGE